MKWTEIEEPYYTINDEKNIEIYNKYKRFAGEDKNIIFGGRLGEYRNYDMDKTIEAAQNLVQKELI